MKKKRMSGKTMDTSFADDLKNYIMGVDIKDVVSVHNRCKQYFYFEQQNND